MSELSKGNIDLMKYAEQLCTEDEIIKSNCKLCNSRFRHEAEQMAERGNNIKAIHRFLTNSGEEISYTATSNHINYHFKAKQSEGSLKEYASQLSNWSKMSLDDPVLIQKYITMLDMEATYYASINANLELHERRKNTELITKITAQIQQLKEASKKLNAERKPVEIVFSSLNRIIEVKLQGSLNPEAKQALKDVIDQLSKEIGEMSFEGVDYD